MPDIITVPGSLIVHGWNKINVMADKLQVPAVMEMTCKRSADLAAGIATLKCLDATDTTRDNLAVGQELEIYLTDTMTSADAAKVWGGYISKVEVDIQTKKVLVIQAKEYSQYLINRFTDSTAGANNSFSATEPGSIINTLMYAYQEEFTTDNVFATSGNILTATYKNKQLFQTIKDICNLYTYVFFVDLLKDLNVRQSATVVQAPTSITYGSNMYSFEKEENKELMANDIVVYGTGSVSSGVYSDDDSINSYLRSQTRITDPSLTTTGACQQKAQALLDTYKDPLPSYRAKCKYIAGLAPFQYINVSVPDISLSGNYQIREVTHTYSKRGLLTELLLGNKITDLSLAVGGILTRVQNLETTTYV